MRIWKMKKIISALVFVIYSFIFLPGCQNIFEPLKNKRMNKDGTGSFLLVINEPNEQGKGRTIMPTTVQNDFTAYTFEFFNADKIAEVTGPDVIVNRVNSNLSSPVLLNEGTWNLYVTAYLNDDKGLPKQAARGILEGIVIGEGEIVNGFITLNPIIDSGEGVFSWSIEYPVNVTVGKMIIIPLDETNGMSERIIYFTGGDPWVGKTDSLSLNAGFYRVDFDLLLNDQERRSMRREILHIYQNMESAFQFTFTDKHFPIDPLGAILDAWDNNKWNLRDSDITAAHFIIAGVDGVDYYNIENIINWFDNNIDTPAADLKKLKVLVDLTLVGIASTDVVFCDAGRYVDRAAAEYIICLLLKNETVMEIIEWNGFDSVHILLDGQYSVWIDFDSAVIPRYTYAVPSNVTVNGVIASITFDPVGPQSAGTKVTATVNFDQQENPANLIYRNDSLWTGWRASGGTVTPLMLDNGVLVVTDNTAASTGNNLAVGTGNVLIIKARQSSGTLGNLVISFGNTTNALLRTVTLDPLSRDWQIFYYTMESDELYLRGIMRNNRDVAAGFLEISDLYIGNNSSSMAGKYTVNLTSAIANLSDSGKNQYVAWDKPHAKETFTFTMPSQKVDDFILTFKTVELSDIRIDTFPETPYLMGEAIDLSGLQVSNVYADGTEEPTNDYSIIFPSEIIRETALRSGVFHINVAANGDLFKRTSFDIIVSNKLIDTGLPVIYIETQDAALINSTEIYNKMNFSISSDNPAYNVVKTGFNDEIRGRGNTTWTYPKKPYRIRFAGDTSLFGMVPARNWVLLANYRDPTLIANTIAFELGQRFGLPFSCNYIHVDLILNGHYQGSYVLTEHMRVAEGRVDIDRNNGFLVELDTYYDEDPKFRTTNLNLPVMIKYPDLGTDIGLPGYDFVREALNNFAAVFSNSNFPNNNYKDIIDIDNFIDYLMIYEIVKNEELGYPKSAFMYRDIGQKIKMGPLWDFDWGFGLNNSSSTVNLSTAEGRYRGGAMFSRLHNDPVFVAKYKERWNKKLPDILSISVFIDEKYNKLNMSASLDNKRWRGRDYEFEVSKLKEWWNRRMVYLNGAINNALGGADSLEGKLLILQAYGSSGTAAGVSHSFVELYNTTTTPINLNGISLYFADGTNHGSSGIPATADGQWNWIALTGTIPARGSYLILGLKQSAGARYQIPDNFGDINNQNFTLSNRAFKVALIRGSSLLTVQNPFNIDGNGIVISGYIDMIGAANTYPGQDMIYGFETAPARNSASAAVRRKNLIDTNNNAGQNDGSGDFISINYSSSGISNEELAVRSPRNSLAGSWNPFQVPSNSPVSPPSPTGNKHLIFQIGAATDGNINRSFVELYNAGDTPLDLTGYSLQYASGTRGTPSVTEDGSWQRIIFSQEISDIVKRIIPPRHSFLILGDADWDGGVSPMANAALMLEISEADLYITDLCISNRSFKVALMQNTTLLTVQNPFGLDGIANVSSGKVPGYVDMVGAMNTVGEDKINGFEYLPITNLNKQTGQRRASLIDTDNNQNDFTRATFAGATSEAHEKLRPKNLAYGAWDPITGLKD